MKNNLLENYLEFLNDQTVVAKVASFVGKNLAVGAKQSLFWGTVVTPAIWLAWRTTNLALSGVARKCGAFGKNTPGRQVCIAKERIKILQQKLKIATQVKNSCGKGKNPELCRQKASLEIDKIKNKILKNQNKIKEVMGENKQHLNETLPVAVAGLAISIFAGIMVDKALWTAWRSLQALFSSVVRKCGTFKKGPERELCISQQKLMIMNKKMMLLNKIMTSCPKQKDPIKCKEKITEKIKDLSRQIQIQKDNLITYKKEIEIKKREEEFKRAQKTESKPV